MKIINKAIAFSLTSIATTAGIFGLSDRTANAQQQYYYIQARHSGQCLNVFNSGQQNGDNVVQGSGCDTANFQWAVIPARNKYNYIEARHSGQCLNVLNSGANNGDNVVQGYACDTPNFQWSLIPASNFRPHNSNYNYRNHRNHHNNQNHHNHRRF